MVATKGITAPADNVMITGGAQHGLNLIARTLLLPRATWC